LSAIRANVAKNGHVIPGSLYTCESTTEKLAETRPFLIGLGKQRGPMI